MTEALLTPPEAARLLAEVILRRLRPRALVGTETSGNYGHAGRPGQVGGSAPRGTTTFYHGTAEARLKSILKEGLTRSHVSQVWEGTKAGHVFVTTDFEGAKFWAQHAADRLTGGGVIATPAVLRVEVPEDKLKEFAPDLFVGQKEPAFEYGGDIPPEWIKEAWTRQGPFKWQNPEPWLKVAAASRTFYVALVLVEEPKTLGGPGSGNFGHSGRPGEVGGSAPSGGESLHLIPDTLGPETETWIDTGANSAEAKRIGVEQRLEKLIDVPDAVVTVTRTEPAVRAADVTADVMEEMKAKGYAMPMEVRVVAMTGGGVGGEVEPWNQRMTIKIPVTLPTGADLDKAVQLSFGGQDKHGRDKFAVRTMHEVIVHEMGHIQHSLTVPRFLDHIDRDFAIRIKSKTDRELVERFEAARDSVSAYGAKSNLMEFVACAFVRKYRGEKLTDDAEALYAVMKGPKIR